MKYGLLIILLLTYTATTVTAQEGRCPKIPSAYSWSADEDYSKDEDLIKKTIKWLCVTPLGVDVQQRSLANAYVMEWLAGAPQIKINITTAHLPFYEAHPDLLFPFLHGIALFKMNKPGITDQLTLYTEGMDVVASLTQQSKELSKSKVLKPLLKAYKKKRMKEYVKQILEGHEKI